MQLIIRDLIYRSPLNMERNLLAGEIRRVKDFALLSENAYSSVQELDDILEYYNLSIF